MCLILLIKADLLNYGVLFAQQQINVNADQDLLGEGSYPS